MGRYNKEQKTLAAKLLADTIFKSIRNVVYNRSLVVTEVFSESTSPPRMDQNVDLVLKLEVPAKLLYEIESKIKAFDK